MPADIGHPSISLDLLHDFSELVAYHFMVNALLAGSIVAVMAGVIGWLMVLRRESFAGHTLSLMAFPGASGATLIGIAPAWGYFGFCALAALGIGRLAGVGRSRHVQASAGIGTVQAAGLAAGFLFVSLYSGVLGGLENLLFGTFLGISDSQVLVLAVVAAVSLALVAVAARPLLFASVDPEAAAAQGVPSAALSTGFLLLLGLAVAATSQITGALLVFALLVAPPAAAQALTMRPAASLLLSVGLALTVVWLGLGIAYFSIYPVGFFITTVAFAIYLLAALVGRLRR
ncbi:MAG: metal ABC transporter permease [Solirubrobacteraceae bacterium]|nr:MAG: metal ABC transporter permease [Solirubrobacterales bacterium]